MPMGILQRNFKEQFLSLAQEECKTGILHEVGKEIIGMERHGDSSCLGDKKRK